MTATLGMHAAIPSASVWVARFAPIIPPGEVLDLACGSGRHARLLAAYGHPVLALDRNAEALQGLCGEQISTMQFDLEEGAAWPFEQGRFSGIVVTNYLHRPLFPHIFSSLADGGILIYETFAIGNGEFGKPSNPAFLLEHGELLELTNKWLPNGRVIAYEDGFEELPRPAVVQRICVMRGEASQGARQMRLN